MKSTSTKVSPITTNRRFKLVWIIALVLLLAVVLIAQWLRRLPGVQSFMTDFPGDSHLSEGAPVGFPAWLGWQHFLNSFFMLLIIRSGWMVRTNQRPAVAEVDGCGVGVDPDEQSTVNSFVRPGQVR